MPLVNWTHPELRKMLGKYGTIRDAIAGQEQVKSKGVKYLPMPNAADQTKENRARYAGYKSRAVFYNVTGRTLRGMVGQIFAKPPEITVPDHLKNTAADMTGIGTNAPQQMKAASNENVAFGRGGILADYPTTNGTVTVQDLQSGKVKPTITLYNAQQIINWRFTGDGGKKKLVLVVLEEPVNNYGNDGFSFTEDKQWRVLRLDASGNYIQELYGNQNASPAVLTPTDYAGNKLDEIPFRFFGSEDNDPEVDNPPLYDLAELNMAHYRNSADYEEIVYICGQPTLVYSGVDRAWIDNVLKGMVVALGATAALPLPKGGDAKLMQAEARTIGAEAMEAKERQMVALGAKLVEQREVQRTATEANQEEAAEASQLQQIADNISLAYAECFAFCSRFVSGNTPKITVKLNTTFDAAFLDPASRAQLLKEWQQGGIVWEEYRAALRKSGVATLPDDEAKAKAQEEATARAALDPDPAQVGGPGRSNPNADE